MRLEQCNGLLLQWCFWWTIVGIVLDHHVGGNDGVVGCVGMDFEAGHDVMMM